MGSDLDFGKIGYTDRGDWSASYNSGNGYEYLDGVTHDDCYWISKENNNTDTPSTSSTKWHRGLNGKVAAQAAAAATTAAGNANDAATLANTKAGAANDAADAATSAARSANEAAEAALAAVVTAELPAVATESNVRAIVSGYVEPEE